MWKKRVLCLVLALSALLVMTACQKKETFPTQAQPTAVITAQPQDQQNIFGDTPVPQEIDFDDGTYDPTQEEGGGEELIGDQGNANGPTTAPTMQSEYAGATPVLIDPIDKPTPTPLPPLSFTYSTYEAPSLHLSFEAPAGWLADDSQPDTYVLTNPDPSMDYAAFVSIRTVPVSKNYNKNELIKEVKGTIETFCSEGFKKYERSNTAGRKFMNTDAIYANYTGTTTDNVKVAGRIIIACSNKTLYILHVSYPQGYTKTYVDNVYDKFRHTVKTISQ
mgnify:CR=1 FL=1